jgi:ribulose-phosphate 3-epimerase
MMSFFDALPRNRLLAEISLWSADLVRLADDLARIDPYTDMYHLDAADGHFSPAFLLFPDLTAAVRKATKKPLHVHLMVQDAILLEQVNQFADAGADIISVHAENKNAQAALDTIEKRNLVGGVVLQVQTVVADARPFLDRVGMLTLLGTRIGVKGQGLDPAAPSRLKEAHALIAARTSKHRIILAADGGIREHTVPDLYCAGAGSVVMGSLAFGAPDLKARMNWIHGFKFAA